ncbi:MAG TPA: hypothetical protein VHC18_26580 [Amycolatopsis sp.]|nr:hypothetical protein [Amycolatopsis sp.]
MSIRWRLPLVAVGAAALLTACAHNGTDPKIASISSAATSAAATSTASDEDQALAYVRCMRENGVNMPDPKTGDGGTGFTIPDGVDKTKVDAAQEKCKSLLPNGGAPRPVSAEDLDKQRQVAKCLREHGVDVPDPTAEDPGIKVQANGSDKARIDAAVEACHQDLPGGGTVTNGGGSR